MRIPLKEIGRCGGGRGGGELLVLKKNVEVEPAIDMTKDENSTGLIRISR